MDEPMLTGGPGNNSITNSEPQGGVIPIRPPIRKSEHPTLSLISPRPRSSTSPLASPRQINESFFTFFLNKEQGRRTEKFYVPPPYGGAYFQPRPAGAAGSSLSFPVPKKLPTPAYLSPSGSSMTSLFQIPEDFPTNGRRQTFSGLAPIKDLEAAHVDEQRRDYEWGETESDRNLLENVELDHEHKDFRPAYHYPSVEDENETIPLIPPPNIGGFNINKVKDKHKTLHKCRTAPVLSSITGTAVGGAHPAEGVKKKVLSETTATTIVWQASIGLMVYLFVGVMIYCWKRDEFKGVETVGWIDALYFCIVTMCTIGYGDITPITPVAKILSCALVLVGFGFVDALMGGMVTFVLDRQEHLLMNVVLDGRHEVAKGYVLNAEKGTMRIRLKVFLAVGTVLGSIAVGTLFLHFVEDLNWIDSIYVTIISITTVGYGDYSFQTMWGRLFAAVWLLLSTLGVARAFLFLAEARVQKRQRHFAKKMLQTRMTATDLMDADIDNDGHVGVAEFVVYKLKAMRKINKKDIVDIVKQFEELDTAGVGKISMTQLLEWEKEMANHQSS